MSVTARYDIGRSKDRRRAIIIDWLNGYVPTVTNPDDCTLHNESIRSPYTDEGDAVCMRCARQIEQRGMRS